VSDLPPAQLSEEEDQQVTSLELFFDLVFVFVITQLTAVIVGQPNWTGVARSLLMLSVVWWMYAGYAWLTNAVPPTTGRRRVLVLAAMGGFFVVALAIPDAFGETGVVLGVAYLCVVVVHLALFATAGGSQTASILRLAPFNLSAAACVLAAGFADGAARYALWAAAFVIEVVGPFLAGGQSGFRIRSGHFVERHGLLVLIVLGESVVAVGVGVEGRDLTANLIVSALLGLAVAAALWWTYFDREDSRAELALRRAPVERRPWLALWAFGYAHLALLFGIVVLAAGMHFAVADPTEELPASAAWLLGAGTAGYLLGDVAMRRTLHSGPTTVRLGAATAALATVPIGRWVAAEAQTAALLAVLVGLVLIEQRTDPAEPRDG
jgi:low temperature requirement protein LtrA